MADAGKGEKTSLLKSSFSDLREAYGTESHAQFCPVSARARGDGVSFGGSESTVDYCPKKLSTFRVCCSIRGTVLTDPVLFTEQIFLTLIFFAVAAPVLYSFDIKTHTTHTGDVITTRKWIEKQEPLMRAFAMIMTQLSAFLLTFYSSMSLARWWVIRTQGVGGIKAATVQLEWVISQFVTTDAKVLSAIRRYGRTSLRLIFIWRRHELDILKEKLLDPENYLTQEELDLLEVWNHCLHETIWAWQMGIVSMLYAEGKIKSDHMFKLLLEHCEDGRKAVQVAHTHIAQRMPMQYVHLLGYLVKMHNVVLAVITGIIFGVAWPNQQYVICCQLLGRTLLLPFLFNAILLINAELSDPFDGSSGDAFPDSKYCNGLSADCKGIVEASEHMPSWIIKRTVNV